jgi:hypothetical protein
MFDHGWMPALPLLTHRTEQVQQLQARIAGMQDGVPRIPVATHPALDGMLQLRTGGAYEVDAASLAMMLLAAPSQQGAWSAVIGANDFGIEAAAELGVDLTRTVLVPDPGEQWLEATAALADVVTLVVLRPPVAVSERTASRISARLRKRSSVLIVWGTWPGSEARLSLQSSIWSGLDAGHGRLRSRRVTVAVRRGSAPAREAELWLPAQDGPVRRTTSDLPTLSAIDGALA